MTGGRELVFYGQLFNPLGQIHYIYSFFNPCYTLSRKVKLQAAIILVSSVLR